MFLLTNWKPIFISYNSMEGISLHQSRHYHKSVQCMLKAVYHSGCHEKHHCLCMVGSMWWLSILLQDQCEHSTFCMTVATVLVFVRLSNWTFDGDSVRDWTRKSVVSLDNDFDMSSVSWTHKRKSSTQTLRQSYNAQTTTYPDCKKEMKNNWDTCCEDMLENKFTTFSVK